MKKLTPFFVKKITVMESKTTKTKRTNYSITWKLLNSEHQRSSANEKPGVTGSIQPLLYGMCLLLNQNIWLMLN